MCRLAKNVLPSYYDLSLSVYDDNYTGIVKIACGASELTSSFEFNANGLEFKTVRIFQGEKEINCNCQVSTEKEKNNQFYTVTMEQSIAGEFILLIDYTGEYGNLDGFYKRVEAKEGSDETFSLFSTHFEPTDARKAFPCFDQPDMKTVFKLSINCEQQYTALSCGEIKHVEKEPNNRKTVHFEETPLMSTYIIAWAVGDVRSVEKKDEDLTVRVFCKNSELEWAKYSLEVAFYSMKFYEEYFDIKYPLSKVDLISIPSFRIGAMENWGLITFRKTSLLFDPNVSFIRSKKNISNTVCHELAHMWFGNLVTMKWWNDLWLKEGFATWAASMAVKELSKTHKDLFGWDEEASFASGEITRGLLTDSLENTHKIAVDVQNPDEISQIFDSISYYKGSSVIYMLEAWMGPEMFRDGIRKYLKEHKYKNAETLDLWESLDIQNSSFVVGELMSHWINRDGFPFITVTEKDSQIILTQERFTKGYEKEDAPWPIPLTIRWFVDNGSEEVEKLLFKDKTLRMEKKSAVYKLNDGMSSFIRVKYPKETLIKLLSKDLSPVNTLNLISDLFELGFALKNDFLSDEKFMNEIISNFKHSENFEVLECLLSKLNELRSSFYDKPEILNKYTELQNSILKIHLNKVDLHSNSSELTRTVNDLARDSLCVSYGCENGIFQVHSKNVHHEFVKSYFVTLADTDYNGLKEFYEKSELPGVKESALVSLSKTTNPENITNLFSSPKWWSFVRKHDVHYFSYAFGLSIKYRHQFAQALMDNFEAFEECVNDSGMFRSVYSGAFGEIFEPEMQNKTIAFLKEKMKKNPQHERVILKVLDNFSAVGELRKRIIKE